MFDYKHKRQLGRYYKEKYSDDSIAPESSNLEQIVGKPIPRKVIFSSKKSDISEEFIVNTVAEGSVPLSELEQRKQEIETALKSYKSKLDKEPENELYKRKISELIAQLKLVRNFTEGVIRDGEQNPLKHADDPSRLMQEIDVLDGKSQQEYQEKSAPAPTTSYGAPAIPKPAYQQPIHQPKPTTSMPPKHPAPKPAVFEKDNHGMQLPPGMGNAPKPKPIQKPQPKTWNPPTGKGQYTQPSFGQGPDVKSLPPKPAPDPDLPALPQKPLQEQYDQFAPPGVKKKKPEDSE